MLHHRRWRPGCDRAALAPLATVTQVATQITHADDLSRRIPLAGNRSDDEVGQLIQAFNATLERLEQLFNLPAPLPGGCQPRTAHPADRDQGQRGPDAQARRGG